MAIQKRRALRQYVYGNQYIWKQPLMTEIGTFVHITDTPCSKVLNTSAWQHMSACLFVCFPNDTPLRLPTELLLPFNTRLQAFELLDVLFDLLTAAATLFSIITHSKACKHLYQTNKRHLILSRAQSCPLNDVSFG
jgi:hypothetical protein